MPQSRAETPPPGGHYLYRCTTDKLLQHLANIEESGDQVIWPVFVGGRDWLLICRKAGAFPTFEITGRGRIHHFDSVTGKVTTYDAPRAATGGEAMSGVIPGVPKTITRDEYLALVRAVGFQTKDLVSLEFKADGIYAEVFAKAADGNRGVDGTSPATHRVYVRVES